MPPSLVDNGEGSLFVCLNVLNICLNAKCLEPRWWVGGASEGGRGVIFEVKMEGGHNYGNYCTFSCVESIYSC